MPSPALSPNQIRLAKKLKEQGKSKRELAKMFNVCSTTIWKHVYYVPLPALEGEKCKKCEIITTREVSGTIPMNYLIGGLCLDCYLKERNLKYIDVIEIMRMM